jgi:hypothetical protein
MILLLISYVTMCPTTTWKELKLASRVGDFTIIKGCKGQVRI